MTDLGKISTNYHVYPSFINNLFLYPIDICKLFSCNSKPLHALLAL